MDDARRIATLDAVPEDGSLVFRVRDRAAGADADGDAGGDEREAILLRLADGGVAAWENRCQHFTHVPLDTGSGVPRRNGELVCANHGALFDAATGECTHGPCRGAVLPDVPVTVADGAVYLADPGLEYVGGGPVPSDPTDMASDSNVEF